nr:hypothetical protein [Tanacetum cinerariifolium]
MLKVDVAQLAPKLQNNRTSHSNYLKHTQEETETLREIVQQGKSLNPLNTSLDYALVNLSTSASGSQPSGNTKKDKIQQTPSSTKKNKIEAHPRTIRSSLRNKNCVVRTKDTASVKNSKLNVNSDLQCVGISHETSIARSPQQNNVVERRTLTTACYIQNRSIIRLHHGKTPYELLQDKIPDLSFFHVFGALCYPTNDSENLEKLQPKADISIFIGFTPTKKAFWIYNRRTKRIIETIHVDFDELSAMASKQSSSGPALHEMTPITISSGLVPNPNSLTPFVPSSRTDYDILFQLLFDELLTPPPSEDHLALEVIAPIAKVVALKPAASTSSPSSTTVDQDAPSPSNSQTT